MAKKQSKVSKPNSTEKKVTKLERVTTGITGFDELIEGGLPKHSFVILSGETGTGKSIFAMNFLAYGAEHGEPGVYVSLEEGYDANKTQMHLFGWDLDKMQKEKKLLILQPKIYDFDKLVESIQDALVSIDAKRLVIDSVSVFQLYFEDKFKTRRSIMDLAKTLKGMDVTTLAITEVDEATNTITRESVEEFVSDGVIMLRFDRKDNVMTRSVIIRKMRSTNHSLKIHPIQIREPTGMVVYPFEQTFE